ncbi:MAG: pantoate--beta-alanine ligase [Planctomycetota bacterium]|nr:pantoate--beta-alanine ligase [Planctomycetota bacterium]
MKAEVIETIREMVGRTQRLRAKGKSIGFVPTMGALHEGHLSLMRRSRAENDVSVISIFVNPTQFAPGEDFEEYPRPIAEDVRKAEEAGVDLIFTTTPEEMYPTGYSTFVEEERVTRPLCGKTRPTFFRGVLTAVLKLCQIVRPHRVYFGEKDFQQCRAVQRMVSDFHLDVEIISCPIVREDDGLALSSRNVYLSASEREEALTIPKSLDLAESLVSEGVRDPAVLVARMTELITEIPSARIDYIETLSADDLSTIERLQGDVLVAVAVWIGKTRLIDNRVLAIG